MSQMTCSAVTLSVSHGLVRRKSRRRRIFVIPTPDVFILVLTCYQLYKLTTEDDVLVKWRRDRSEMTISCPLHKDSRGEQDPPEIPGHRYNGYDEPTPDLENLCQHFVSTGGPTTKQAYHLDDDSS